MTKPEEFDPFAAGQKTPAISFKDQPVGTVRSLLVTEYATTAATTDYKTGEPLFWKDGKPRMSAVLTGTHPETGEPLSLWADIPSSKLAAVRDAQEAVKPGYRIKPGDRVDIQHYADKPGDDPKKNAQKLYRAKVTVGVEPPPVTDDPWASTAGGANAANSGGFGDEPPF